MSSVSDDEVFEVLSLLWELHHEMQAASKRMNTRLGVTGPQRLVIRVLGRRGELSPGEISRLLHLHPSTLTGIFQRLLDRGLIRHVQDAEDGRRKILTLTPRGRTVDRLRTGTVEHAIRKSLETANIKEGRAALQLVRRAIQFIREE